MTAYPLSIPIYTTESATKLPEIRLQATVIPATCGPGSITIGQLLLFINTFSKALLLFFALVNLRNAHSRNARPQASCSIFQPHAHRRLWPSQARPLLALVLTWRNDEGWDEIFARVCKAGLASEQSAATQRERRES